MSRPYPCCAGCGNSASASRSTISVPATPRLSYLRKFPLDKIKIDRSFVTDIATRSDQVAIIQAVLSIARALGMTVTAEGVETAIQKDFLKALGCDNAQGYLFGKPVPFEEIVEIVARPANVKADGGVNVRSHSCADRGLVDLRRFVRPVASAGPS